MTAVSKHDATCDLCLAADKEQCNAVYSFWHTTYGLLQRAALVIGAGAGASPPPRLGFYAPTHDAVHDAVTVCVSASGLKQTQDEKASLKMGGGGTMESLWFEHTFPTQRERSTKTSHAPAMQCNTTQWNAMPSFEVRSIDMTYTTLPLFFSGFLGFPLPLLCLFLLCRIWFYEEVQESCDENDCDRH